MGFRKADKLYYQAEEEARVDLMGAFPCVEDAQLYADHIIGRSWFRELAEGAVVEVRYVRRVQMCGTQRVRGKFVVELTLGRLCEGVLLHELAHIPTYVPDLAHNDHGPAFAKAHLTILAHGVSIWSADQLAAALKKRGLRFE